ncbi:hypothetical protein BAU15_07195 [Enterococcus sp. JM4C]|uniref:hypothetical protein n=1 Tax=Candidatus Enterococcus huntleyi TaxID=1857217 RepID=UPI0013798F36|nr:hypothetical protein [Enterococcus sp. JM4C]KAF1297493.1 hypothetical protein BAU15_07195 [Enterococcus sp. JM4C]
MTYLTGTVSKIKILSYAQQPLVRFTLQTNTQKINCLIAVHSLTFLAEVAEQMSITVIGKPNTKGQLVVRNYRVAGKTKIMYEFEQSRYPKSKQLL